MQGSKKAVYRTPDIYVYEATGLLVRVYNQDLKKWQSAEEWSGTDKK